MLEGFKKFTQHGRGFKPKISIRKRGQIGFNNGAIKRFQIDKYEYVVLYYNKDTNKMAFNFTNSENDDGAIKIMKKKNNYFISGKSFFDYYDIPYGESQSFDVEWNQENLLAIIDIGDNQDDQNQEVSSEIAEL